MKKKISVLGLHSTLGGKKGKTHFQLLTGTTQDEIENQLGEPLEWNEKPNQNDSRITLRKVDTDPANETDWHNQHEWLASKVELFYQIFKPRIDELKRC